MRSLRLPGDGNEEFQKEFNHYLEQLFRSYVYYDSPKNKRITPEEVNKIMNQTLKNNNLTFRSNFKIEIKDTLEQLDFVIKTQDRLKIIKTFSFDFKSENPQHASSQAKIWAWNYHKMKKDNSLLSKMKKRFEVPSDFEYELSTLVYLNNSYSDKIKGALEVLEEESNLETVFELKEITDYANRLSPQKTYC